MILAERLKPCGPVVDAPAAGRLLEGLIEAADDGGWRDLLDRAWQAVEPVFAASPYLASLVRRSPERLRATLAETPEDRLEGILRGTASLEGGADAVKAPLRSLKADLHLLTALADLGGVWDLDQVTGALSRFADASAQTALAAVAHDQRERGRLTSDPEEPRGPIPGLFGLAMGKHGAFELNYSSDIDLSLFYEPDALADALGPGQEPQAFVNRVAQGLANLLSERTADGYVFRVDLRLRPDPSSTPPVVAAPMALAYYESVGQNWERAAFIKARVMLGDLAAGEGFLKALRPFVWRRSLDYPAILDIQSIKRQIHVHKTGEGLEAAGANLKLGRGGIREIEFFAQTQQLILGGRDRRLRERRTVDALRGLAEAGVASGAVAAELTEAYADLRGLEHRVQMLEDEQTHALPVDAERRRAVAALAGEGDLAAFDARVEARLAGVNRRYGELFEGEEALSSPHGSLVFTGVENDPETLATLARMGFSEPETVADTIRQWHHGRIGATRTARGRELFTRLAPRLLMALEATGAPDAAFRRFAVFFSALSAGVQVQALFLNQPKLFELVVGVMAFAPRLARMLGRRPAALDSLMDARLLRDLDEDSGVVAEMLADAAATSDLEGAMNAARRIHSEQMFRIGVHGLTGRASGASLGQAYSTLADAVVRALAPAALADLVRQAGEIEGSVAVVALGKAGSREMTAGSDLDLMVVYDAPGDAMAARKGWAAEVFYARFTQRLIAALSAHTAEGGLYEVDMRLRPSGSKGPVSVRLGTFAAYYASEADTWEFMVLTRARVAWSSDPAFEAAVGAAIKTALRSVDRDDMAGDVARMRALMDRERPPQGFWDLKLSPGGQVDAEFIAQYRQLEAARTGGPLSVSTLEQLRHDPVAADSWRLHQRLGQILACAFEDGCDPESEPEPFRVRLAGVAGMSDFETLKARLVELRAETRAALNDLLSADVEAETSGFVDVGRPAGVS